MRRLLIGLFIFFSVCYILNNLIFIINRAKHDVSPLQEDTTSFGELRFPKREHFNQGLLIASVDTQKLIPYFNNPNIPQKQSTINFDIINNIKTSLQNIQKTPNSALINKTLNNETYKLNNIMNNIMNNTTNPTYVLNEGSVSLSVPLSDIMEESNNIFSDYGPFELIYINTNAKDNKIDKYYRRRKLSDNSTIYYIETYYGKTNKPVSTIFYNAEDLKLPDMDILKQEQVVLGLRNLGKMIIENRLTLYGYNNKIYLFDKSYDGFQPMLITFRTSITPSQMKYKIYTIFGINYQSNAYTDMLENEDKTYNKYIVYLRPSICDDLIKKFPEKLIVIPLLQELKFNINGITERNYNSYGLNETYLCLRVGSFIPNNPDEIIKVNDELINFVIDSAKIKSENIYYRLLNVEGFSWDAINDFMNKLSTYVYVFQISLLFIKKF